jgi:hypothetical protein
MPSPIRFSLNLSADRYLRFYQGRAKSVSVLADDGRRVEFPANALRPFVTRTGVQGHFEIRIDAHQRLQQIRRIDAPSAKNLRRQGD